MRLRTGEDGKLLVRTGSGFRIP